uniref:Uncharacterized protein n=1 Tax=Romanomermis culicivorax TaxID=13658 RepID=A0A915KD81_ROMCU
MVSKSNLDAAQKEYIPGKENAFADFLSRKYGADQTDNKFPTTSNAAAAMDKINVVETRAKTRKKLATPPLTDLEVPETPEEDKIVDPADLPNQDQWPFMQQQIADTQKVDPKLHQTRQKVENQQCVVFIAIIFALLHIFPQCVRSLRRREPVPRVEACAVNVPTLIQFCQLTTIPFKPIGISTIMISIASESPNFCTLNTTFNCLVSTVYNLVRVVDSLVLEIIKHLRESQFCGVKIISIDTEQVSGY